MRRPVTARQRPRKPRAQSPEPADSSQASLTPHAPIPMCPTRERSRHGHSSTADGLRPDRWKRFKRVAMLRDSTASPHAQKRLICTLLFSEVYRSVGIQIRRSGPPGGWHQRSAMCLTAWLITNACAGLCIRMRRGNSLISATWPRFAIPVRGSPAGPVQASTLWWYAIGFGVTHAGMRAEARPRHAWAGWARWGFLGFPGPAARISCQTPRSGGGPHVWAVPLRRTVPKGRAK
jgi:hypothetical protein